MHQNYYRNFCGGLLYVLLAFILYFTVPDVTNVIRTGGRHIMSIKVSQ